MITFKYSKNLVPYNDAINFMEKQVLSHTNDLIWGLQHDHVYTMGKMSNPSEILTKTDISILQTSRGGKTTYHGPGQLIIYIMLDLKFYKKDINCLFNKL